VAHAYAMIEDGVGRFKAVHLTNVLAESVEVLEPSGRSEPAAHGMQRIELAMKVRHRRKEWGK
jgi:hypothetical protein